MSDVVSYCASCGLVSVGADASPSCGGCDCPMQSQNIEQNGIRKGLLQVHKRFFSNARSFVPVAFNDETLFILASDERCPSLVHFCDKTMTTTAIISSTPENVELARSLLYDDSSDAISKHELEAFTQFAGRNTPVTLAEATPTYCNHCGHLLSGGQQKRCPGCDKSRQ